MAAADFQPVGDGVEEQRAAAVGGFPQPGHLRGHRQRVAMHPHRPRAQFGFQHFQRFLDQHLALTADRDVFLAGLFTACRMKTAVRLQQVANFDLKDIYMCS